MTADQTPLRKPRPLGCLLGFLWLAMIPITVLFLAAGYSSIAQGYAQDSYELRSLGWWLIAAGIASSTILCCILIINIRLRRLIREHRDEEQRKEERKDELRKEELRKEELRKEELRKEESKHASATTTPADPAEGTTNYSIAQDDLPKDT